MTPAGYSVRRFCPLAAGMAELGKRQARIKFLEGAAGLAAPVDDPANGAAGKKSGSISRSHGNFAIARSSDEVAEEPKQITGCLDVYGPADLL